MNGNLELAHKAKGIMEHTLEVYSNGGLIFHSNGKWLYPLFELEHFLRENEYNPKQLFVKDKIIGKAAAMILIYLKIRHVDAGIMSDLAKDILEAHSIEYSYTHLVDKIQCRTESILMNESEPEKAYDIVKQLAQKAMKK